MDVRDESYHLTSNCFFFKGLTLIVNNRNRFAHRNILNMGLVISMTCECEYLWE